MRVYDISMTVNPEMPVWNNNQDRAPRIATTRDFVEGKGARESQLTIDMHTGTHIDAPLHFVPGGRTIESISVDNLVREVRVVDLTHLQDRVTGADLAKVQPQSGEFLLLKTRNSWEERFDPGFVFVDKTGAQVLIEAQVAGVGIDSLGIERSQPDHETHIDLLSQGIVILEGLRLATVPAGGYFMVAAPLKLEGVEAAPARVFLLAMDS